MGVRGHSSPPIPFTNDNIIYKSVSFKVIPPIQKHVCIQPSFFMINLPYSHTKGLALTFRGHSYMLRVNTEYS
jgi:hypothetical protein